MYGVLVREVVQVTELHMPQDKQAALLDVVDKIDELGRLAGPRHHQQDLWPPVLDVRLADVQHQQVLPHLERTCDNVQQWQSVVNFYTDGLEIAQQPTRFAFSRLNHQRVRPNLTRTYELKHVTHTFTRIG